MYGQIISSIYSKMQPKDVNGLTMIMIKLTNFASKCVETYATYDEIDGFCSLSVQDLPDFIQNEFAGLIFQQEPFYATEAIGPDNDLWETKMLPALTQYLKDITDKDAEIIFTSTWRDCVTSYVHDHMQELIDDALQDYNDRHGYTRKVAYGGNY